MTIFLTNILPNFLMVRIRVPSILFSIGIKRATKQAHGALGETSDKSDFSFHALDSFGQEIRDLLLIFYCQKSLNLFELQ